MSDDKLRGLSAQLVEYMTDNGWYSKGTLTADMIWKHPRGRNYGKRYLPETVGRVLRHLEESSIIAVKDDGISVQYKWIPVKYRGQYIPYSARPDYKKDVLFRK